MKVTVVYIYGTHGCGLLRDVFAQKCDCKLSGAAPNLVSHLHVPRKYGPEALMITVDDFGSHNTIWVSEYIEKLDEIPGEYYIILCGNEEPDYINLHMDHVFKCSEAKEALDFIKSLFRH